MGAVTIETIETVDNHSLSVFVGSTKIGLSLLEHLSQSLRE